VPVEAVSAVVLHRFNALPEAEARASLLACCASSAWTQRVLAGRPYGTVEQLLDAAEHACRSLPPQDVDEALSAHPRIGDRADGPAQEASWSRQEQSSVTDADAATKRALRAGNVEYEQRFGRVFLIRAAGRAPGEMLAELRRRLVNDPEAERREVVDQLAQITRLRVEKLLAA
jgi:2-oxo-4-hydroxy-4-carboxy-5-ureidoimidazoline decarboxylase